jgi:hypothetical protein
LAGVRGGVCSPLCMAINIISVTLSPSILSGKGLARRSQGNAAAETTCEFLRPEAWLRMTVWAYWAWDKYLVVHHQKGGGIKGDLRARFGSAENGKTNLVTYA